MWILGRNHGDSQIGERFFLRRRVVNAGVPILRVACAFVRCGRTPWGPLHLGQSVASNAPQRGASEAVRERGGKFVVSRRDAELVGVISWPPGADRHRTMRSCPACELTWQRVLGVPSRRRIGLGSDITTPRSTLGLEHPRPTVVAHAIPRNADSDRSVEPWRGSS